MNKKEREKQNTEMNCLINYQKTYNIETVKVLVKVIYTYVVNFIFNFQNSGRPENLKLKSYLAK